MDTKTFAKYHLARLEVKESEWRDWVTGLQLSKMSTVQRDQLTNFFTECVNGQPHVCTLMSILYELFDHNSRVNWWLSLFGCELHSVGKCRALHDHLLLKINAYGVSRLAQVYVHARVAFNLNAEEQEIVRTDLRRERLAFSKCVEERDRLIKLLEEANADKSSANIALSTAKNTSDELVEKVKTMGTSQESLIEKVWALKLELDIIKKDLVAAQAHNQKLLAENVEIQVKHVQITGQLEANFIDWKNLVAAQARNQQLLAENVEIKDKHVQTTDQLEAKFIDWKTQLLKQFDQMQTNQIEKDDVQHKRVTELEQVNARLKSEMKTLSKNSVNMAILDENLARVDELKRVSDAQQLQVHSLQQENKHLLAENKHLVDEIEQLAEQVKLLSKPTDPAAAAAPTAVADASTKPCSDDDDFALL